MAADTCPSCGAAISFRASVSVYTVCTSCGSMVVKSGIALEAIGQAASLPDEVTPLQIGTNLSWHDHKMTIIGRMRVGWADGAWNEWFVDGGNRQGWVAEAQGLLSIAFEEPVPELLAGALPRLGDRITINDHRFRVSDVKQTTCLGSEGELPFRAAKGRTATSIDMLSPTAAFAGIEEANGERRLYRGSFMTFGSFHFSNLREIEGWTAPKPDALHPGDPRIIAPP